MESPAEPPYVCTPAQTDVILRNRYKYVWQIVYADGETLDQIAPDGVEQRIDFLRPMCEASWIPVVPGLTAATIVVPEGHHIILARRTFQMMNGSTFIASYILGVQGLGVGGLLQQKVWVLSPPATGIVIRDSQQVSVQFEGVVEEVPGDHSNFVSAAQRWVGEVKPLVVL